MIPLAASEKRSETVRRDRRGVFPRTICTVERRGQQSPGSVTRSSAQIPMVGRDEDQEMKGNQMLS